MARAHEMICDVLIEAGVDHVFGIPGGGTIPIWNALYDKQDRINVILARHEQGASCMADIYGRIKGKPAVLMGQGAFIASSGGFGILEAYLSNSPMLILADTSDMGNFSQHASYQSGSGEYGSFDIRDIFRGMCKFTTYAVNPEEVIQGVQLAIKHSMAGRPGPACVIMRNRAITGKVNMERIPMIHPTGGYLKGSNPVAPDDDIKNAAEILKEANKPVIIAGNGVHLSRAHGELQDIAELLGAPVATSYKGKSAIAEIHPLALGMMGNFGQKVANSTIAQADVLLVAGCRLSPSDTLYANPKLIDPARQKIIQLDIDPRNAGWTYPVEMAVVGELKSSLSRLTEFLTGEIDGANERKSEIKELKSKGGYFDADEASSNASPILPQRIAKEIEESIDDSALITLDAGNNRLWTGYFMKSKKAGSVFCPGGVAGMGWGPPAALAVKILHPDRPVISVSGDGGFAMMLHVLSTALQYNLGVVFLIMNNSMLGMISDNQGDKKIASQFIPTDFAKIAQAFGCRGVNVEKPEELKPAIKEAMKASGPTVIDVLTSKEEPFLKIMSR